MNKKQSYLEEAQAYYDQAMHRAMAAPMRRSLVLRAGTIAALGGASALNALLAACGAGGQSAEQAQMAIDKVEGKEKLLYPQFNPLVSKYNWRNLPWPTTPYIDGRYVLSGSGLGSYALLTSGQTSYARFWQTPMQQNYGAGVDLEHPPMVPSLADKATNAPDYSYFDYHIRPNSYFHNVPPVNGRLCTAEDVRYSLEAWRTKSIVSASMDSIDRIEVLPDKETVRVHLKKPVLWMNYLMGSPNYHVFAKEHYEGDQDVWKQQPIGTGPMVVTESVIREKLKMVRHEKYSYVDPRWPGYKLPFIRAQDHIYIGDVATAKSGFRSKQIDVLGIGALVDFNDMLATNPEATVQILVNVGYYPPGAYNLNNKDPLLKDVRVRRALSMALDRNTMITLLTGGLGMPAHPVSWNQAGRSAPYALEEMGPYMQYNPVKAKELLKEAGYPDGFELEHVTSTAAGDLDQMIASYFKNVGVRLKFDRQEASVVANKQSNRNYKHMIGAWYPSSLFGVKPARDIFMPDSALNWSYIDDPEMTALVDKATYTLDADEQIRLMDQINRRSFDQAYQLQLYVGFYNEFWHPWLQNRASAVSGYALYFGSWQDAILWISDKAPGDRAGKLKA